MLRFWRFVSHNVRNPGPKVPVPRYQCWNHACVPLGKGWVQLVPAALVCLCLCENVGLHLPTPHFFLPFFENNQGGVSVLAHSHVFLKLHSFQNAFISLCHTVQFAGQMVLFSFEECKPLYFRSEKGLCYQSHKAGPGKRGQTCRTTCNSLFTCLCRNRKPLERMRL